MIRTTGGGSGLRIKTQLKKGRLGSPENLEED